MAGQARNLNSQAQSTLDVDRAPTAAEIRFDEASARFLNAHRKERRVMTPADYADPLILKKSHVPNGGLA